MGDMNIHITWLTHVRTGPKKKKIAGGQVENAEVRKPKYGNGSEKNSHLSVFSALLTHECVC